MRNILKESILRYALLLIVANACVKLPTDISQYEINRLHRKNLRNQPCIVGRIDHPLKRDGRVQYIGNFQDKQII